MEILYVIGVLILFNVFFLIRDAILIKSYKREIDLWLPGLRGLLPDHLRDLNFQDNVAIIGRDVESYHVRLIYNLPGSDEPKHMLLRLTREDKSLMEVSSEVCNLELLPKRYGHGVYIWFLAPVAMLFFAYMAYFSWTFEGEMRGGEVSRYGIILVMFILIVLIGWLLVISGFSRYILSEEGLEVVTPWSKRFRRWDELCAPEVNNVCRFFRIRDVGGKTFVYSSCDSFANLDSFLNVVREKIM